MKRVCNLEILVDHTLFEAVLEDLNGEEEKARDTIIAMIATHTASVSEVFKSTSFNGVTDIVFEVQRIQINDSSSCEGRIRRMNPFCREDMDATHMLFELSKSNHDHFCASYMWTHRDFPGGTLGLAFLAEASSDSGGICDLHHFGANVDVATQYHGELSLNTGIVTFLNNNVRLSQRDTEITFAHEMGHSFGSPSRADRFAAILCAKRVNSVTAATIAARASTGAATLEQVETARRASSGPMQCAARPMTPAAPRTAYSATSQSPAGLKTNAALKPSAMVPAPSVRHHCGGPMGRSATSEHSYARPASARVQCATSSASSSVSSPGQTRAARSGACSLAEKTRLQPGAPCDNLHGYCDVFHRCRPLDAEGPITRLQWLVFGHKGITNVLLKYWYLTSLGFLITSVLTVLLVRVCSTYTPSSNPQLSPNKKILSDSIRHPLDNLLGHFRRDI